jgi:hypothetical protein
VNSEAAAAAGRIPFHHLQIAAEILHCTPISICVSVLQKLLLQKFFELATGVTTTVAGICYLVATWQNVQNPGKDCNLSCNLCKCKKSRMGDASSVEKVESALF